MIDKETTAHELALIYAQEKLRIELKKRSATTLDADGLVDEIKSLAVFYEVAQQYYNSNPPRL